MTNHSNEDLLDAFCKGRSVNKKDIAQMQVFDRIIFMGAGGDTPSRNHTGQQIAILHHKIDYILSLLSGIQQNGLQGHRFDHDSNNEDCKQLHKMVEEVVMALTGISVNIPIE